ncbi:MAG: hypothetical protein PHF63_00855 [Herbinix sp.]|nr:hypothetical protein [Herbinix sp.]
MAQKTEFQKTLEELTTSKSTFSRSDFETVAKALINEVEYSTEVCKIKNGELIKETIMPVKDFRKGMRDILVSFGVDKQDAEKIMSADFKITKTDWFYPLISELITSYMSTGHKFTFLPKDDFMASIKLAKREATTKEFTNPKTKQKFKKTIPEHTVLVKQSSCPSWRKKKSK